MKITKARDMVIIGCGPLYMFASRDDYLRRGAVTFGMNKRPRLSWAWLRPMKKRSFTIREPLWFARLRFYMPRRLQRTKTWLNPLPVYYAVDSTDCDHVHATSAHRASSGRAFLREHDDIFAGAEGPTYVSICSKAEYEAFEPVWRDYNLEAFENGHPHSPRR